MDLHKLIEQKLRSKREIRTSELVKQTGLSRTYVNRILQQLERDGTIRLVGKANRARYVPANSPAVRHALDQERSFRRFLQNRNLQEDEVFAEIRTGTGILHKIPKNVERIVEYGFTEMLNNAIEHSESERIMVEMHRSESGIFFTVLDRGVGIFNKIMTTRSLANEREAIQDLLKGKQTTAPEAHSGEGIFFTSKAADLLEIKSSTKKIIFDNKVPDIFLRDVRTRKGTRVDFRISLGSQRQLQDVFARFTNEAFTFAKTSVSVELYKTVKGFVSRSQARRLLTGLERFQTIILDFRNVESVGQGFVDEIFRVWITRNPNIAIGIRNANESVQIMIDHVNPMFAPKLNEDSTKEDDVR